MKKLPMGTLIPLAKATKIHPKHLSDIVNTRKRPGRKTALLLEEKCRELGIPITAGEWIFADTKTLKSKILKKGESHAPTDG